MGLEPTTTRLRALRSTDWARRAVSLPFGFYAQWVKIDAIENLGKFLLCCDKHLRPFPQTLLLWYRLVLTLHKYLGAGWQFCYVLEKYFSIGVVIPMKEIRNRRGWTSSVLVMVSCVFKGMLGCCGNSAIICKAQWSALANISHNAGNCQSWYLTVWPSGLRRWLQAPVRKGVGSNPTAVISLVLVTLQINLSQKDLSQHCAN